jgi:hypothetical protein
MAAAFAFVPKRKTLAQVAALGAALLISLQLAAEHWFYLYIVWFYPLLLVAMTSPDRDRGVPLEPADTQNGALISAPFVGARDTPRSPSSPS